MKIFLLYLTNNFHIFLINVLHKIIPKYIMYFLETISIIFQYHHYHLYVIILFILIFI
jgi:hypothetical protein